MILRYSLPQITNIFTDENKFKLMLDIELLVVEAQSNSGLIPISAVSRMRKKAKFNLKNILELEKSTHHDVVAFITDISKSLGDDAKFLHIGLTSNDLNDTVLCLQMREACEILLEDLRKLQQVLKAQARNYKNLVCIGRTHGVHAEPVTFGLKLALMFDETRRNISRLECAKEEISVGKLSGAVGTYAHNDPKIEQYVCRKLRLKPIVATQIVPRDLHAKFLSTLAVVASSLERFATEIRHLQRTEVLEAEEPFAKGQKGSSAMPHKRNPVICERICGLARVIKANALVGFDNVALWHERDISHSSSERIIIPDSMIALDYILNKTIEVFKGLKVYPENMKKNLERTGGLIFSQKVLLKLMDKGLPRMKAYEIVQRNALKAWNENLNFKKLMQEDALVNRYLNISELNSCFDLTYYLRNINKIYKQIGI